MVIALCQQLKQKGYRPFIISRGYKSLLSNHQTALRVAEHHSARDVGDEPLMLSKVAPVWISKNRVLAAKAAEAAGATHIIMDDGFQNPTLFKDLSFIIMNGAEPFGNRALFPAGPMREFAFHAFKRADAVISIDDQAQSHGSFHDLPLFTAAIEAKAPDLPQTPLIAFCGLALPEKFKVTLDRLGASIAEFIIYPDHHFYEDEDFKTLNHALEQHSGAHLVTTRKDFVRLPPHMQDKTAVVDIDLTLDHADDFNEFLFSHLQKSRFILPTLSLRRRVIYFGETLLAYALYGFFALLPLDRASNLGGLIMRKLGPRLGASKRALKNITLAFPDKTADDHHRILIEMWDNLGRVIAEYPHLHHIWDRVDFIGKDHIITARDDGKAGILFGGHIANWEIQAIAAKRIGLDLHLVYRKPNNPYVDGLLRFMRNSGAAGHIQKGGDGARHILSLLKRGEHVGMLVDQKLNEGLPIPFFGRDAMTAAAIATFALKFNCPLFPARVERLQGAHFRMRFYPAMQFNLSGDKDQDLITILTAINQLLESWIRENPAQWLWTHRRWPD
jgi:KDO2-lipid IV(A) lauroyltransferase